MVVWRRIDLIFLSLVLWESSAITNKRSVVKHNGNVRNFRHIGGSSTSFADWEIGLRESVNQALLREGYQDPNLRERVLRAPLIGKQDSATPFGDVAVLARGQLYALVGGNFAFVQDPYTNDCDECHNSRRRRMCGAYQCEVWRPQHHERLLALWNVKRLRHRSHSNYHYEIQYTISPLSSTLTEAYVTRNGRYDYTIPGHVFVIRNNVINKNLPTAFPEIYNKRIPHENFNPEILLAVDSDGNKFFLHSYPAFFTALPTYEQDYSTKDPREMDLYKKLIQALAEKTSTTRKEQGPFKVSLNHLGDTTKPSREKYPTTIQNVTPSTPVYVPVMIVPGTKVTQPNIIPSTKPSIAQTAKPSTVSSTKPSTVSSTKPSTVSSTKPSIVPSTKPTELKPQSMTTEAPKVQKVTPSMKTMVHFFVPVGAELMTTKPMEKVPMISKPIQRTTTEESAAFLFPDFERPTTESKKMSQPTKTITAKSNDADFLFPTPTMIYQMLASKSVPLPSATSLTTVTVKPWQTITSTTTSLTTPLLSNTIENTTTPTSTLVPSSMIISTKQTTKSTSKFQKTTSTTFATTSKDKKQGNLRSTKPAYSSTKFSKPIFSSKVTKPYSTTLTSSTKKMTQLSTLTPKMEKSLTTTLRYTTTSKETVPAQTSEITKPVTTTSKSVEPSSTSQITESFSSTKITQPKITIPVPQFSSTKITQPKITRPTPQITISSSSTKITQPDITKPKSTAPSILTTTQPYQEYSTKIISPIVKTTEPSATTPTFTLLSTSTRVTSKITTPQEIVTLSREFPTQTTKTISDLTESPPTTQEAREVTDTEFDIIPDMIPTEPMHIVTQNPLENKVEQEQLPSPNKDTETTMPYLTTNNVDLEQTNKEPINVTSTVTTANITEAPTTETSTLIILSTPKHLEETTEVETSTVQKTTNTLESTQIQEYSEEIMKTSERQKETTVPFKQTTYHLLDTTGETDKETTQENIRMNETTIEVFPTTSAQTNTIVTSMATKHPTKKIVTITTAKLKPTSGEPMRSRTPTSNFLTDGEPVNAPINVNPVHKDYNEDDIFGTTKLTKKTTISTTVKPTESDLAIQLFNRKRRRKAKASSKVIFTNFYEASTATMPTETSSQENNEPQLLTSQSVETSISFEVNKRNKIPSPLSTKATVDEVMKRDGYTVYKAEFPEHLNMSTTENSKKAFDHLAVQLVNHARTIDYLSQMESKTSIKPKYKRRRNYRPKYRRNKEKKQE